MVQMGLADTIVAIATAVVPGQGSVAMLRLSGSQALSIGQRLFRPAQDSPWQSHRLRYGWMIRPPDQVLDEGMAVWMKAPHSYTCEDVVELHCHGGIMAIQQVLQACVAAGARQATPGEFSLRAFLNGRIELTQAESIHDLIQSRSPQAAAMAVTGVQGRLATSIRALRQQGLSLLAELEARIDFEEDLPPLDVMVWRAQLASLQEQVDHWLTTANRGSLLRQGLEVAIVGQPNVGKSSLLNLWSGVDRAIVTDLPGTTRDVVDSHLVVAGIPVHLLDTAGIRDTRDQVEALGVERARQLAATADVVILVMDATQGWTKADQIIYDLVAQRPVVIVINKVDLGPSDQQDLPAGSTGIALSTITGEGLAELEAAIERLVNQGSLASGDPTVAINSRHQALLIQVQTALCQVQEAITDQLPLDFWTIGLRSAVHLWGEITGEDMTESVLDQIFSRFCIGK